jgi:hypothetical protein
LSLILFLFSFYHFSLFVFTSQFSLKTIQVKGCIVCLSVVCLLFLSSFSFLYFLLFVPSHILRTRYLSIMQKFVAAFFRRFKLLKKSTEMLFSLFTSEK